MREDESEQDWRDLSYDVGWETGPQGAIRCKRVLNRRDDIFKAVEGLHPRVLFCESQGKSLDVLLREGHKVRHLDVRLPFGAERLYVTARTAPGGGAIGTFCAIDPALDVARSGTMALLEHITETRGREEIYRREAETMLRGLRLLLGDLPANEKLDGLAALMQTAIRGCARLILQAGRDGTPRILAGNAPMVRDTGTVAKILELGAPVTLYSGNDESGAALRAMLGVRQGDVAAILLPAKSGNILLLCAARRDFTPQNIDFARRFALLLEQALILKDEQARAIQAAKLSALGQMAASLAHELCQPLNTISAAAQNLEMLSEKGAVAETVLRQKIARILGQTERAARIMERMRRFSRKSGAALVPVDIVAIADGVRILMDHLLTPAGIALELDTEAGLSLRCDSTAIEQVLVNLVRNAMDALTGIGAIAPTSRGVIILRGRRVAGGIVLRVEDNGPGFPPDVESRPPETFFTTKGASEGTGLGLSICHMIAREHGGALRLGNHSGGAFVELLLPERAP